AQEYPEVETEELIVDAFAALLVRQPERYDVVVATNFYGDILSDLASELSGSLGLAGSINANAETGRCCAQAQHGSAPDIAGQNIANPTSLILSAAMMLSWLGEQRGVGKMMQAGAKITQAIDTTLNDPAKRTRDLGGSANTDVFGRYVAEAVSREAMAA
ncbi:MAG: isocitrate/isopropylmalate family dehydrogenase, partial [Pseudomonadota bacterium]